MNRYFIIESEKVTDQIITGHIQTIIISNGLQPNLVEYENLEKQYGLSVKAKSVYEFENADDLTDFCTIEEGGAANWDILQISEVLYKVTRKPVITQIDYSDYSGIIDHDTTYWC